ncbi:MAG TPA: DUF3303 family protein [Dehalococcoidia bacterium]|nr:DUF3303 family protein [Dehalococcoidia bacterium]
MLFHVTWEFIDTSEEGARRVLNVFSKWQPAAGAEFKGFYQFADNTGGVGIIEIDSAATLARLTAPFIPWMRFTASPILEVQEATPIDAEAMAFRDSVQ